MEAYDKKWKSFYKNRDMDENELRVSIIKKIIRTGLFHENPEINFLDYSKIYIDLDSLFSRLIDEDMPNDKDLRHEVVSSILNIFKDFMYFYAEHCRIYLIYGFKRLEIFNKIYPNWCIERYKRYENEDVMKYLKNDLLKRLQKFTLAVSNVDMIEYRDAPVLEVLRDVKVSEDSNILVISRDPHYLCILPYKNIDIYNGKNILNRNNYYTERNMTQLHYAFIPNWFLLRGDTRNGYEGIKGFGPKKADDYIQKNKTEILKGEDPKFKELEVYRKLYFLNELLEGE